MVVLIWPDCQPAAWAWAATARPATAASSPSRRAGRARRAMDGRGGDGEAKGRGVRYGGGDACRGKRSTTRTRHGCRTDVEADKTDGARSRRAARRAGGAEGRQRAEGAGSTAVPWPGWPQGSADKEATGDGTRWPRRGYGGPSDGSWRALLQPAPTLARPRGRAAATRRQEQQAWTRRAPWEVSRGVVGGVAPCQGRQPAADYRFGQDPWACCEGKGRATAWSCPAISSVVGQAEARLGHSGRCVVRGAWCVVRCKHTAGVVSTRLGGRAFLLALLGLVSSTALLARFVDASASHAQQTQPRSIVGLPSSACQSTPRVLVASSEGERTPRQTHSAYTDWPRPDTAWGGLPVQSSEKTASSVSFILESFAACGPNSPGPTPATKRRSTAGVRLPSSVLPSFVSFSCLRSRLPPGAIGRILQARGGA